MKKLIFICHGNTFRSPIAEAIFNHNPKEGWKASSYGTAVLEEKVQGLRIADSPYHLEIAIKEMEKRGMDISEKCCDQLFPEYLEGASNVIVMSESKYEPDWLLDKRFERWEIPNPEIVTQDITEKIIDLLTEKIEDLKKRL